MLSTEIAILAKLVINSTIGYLLKVANLNGLIMMIMMMMMMTMMMMMMTMMMTMMIIIITIIITIIIIICRFCNVWLTTHWILKAVLCDSRGQPSRLVHTTWDQKYGRLYTVCYLLKTAILT